MSSSGVFATRINSSATLPMSRYSNPVRPWVPMMMRVATPGFGQFLQHQRNPLALGVVQFHLYLQACRPGLVGCGLEQLSTVRRQALLHFLDVDDGFQVVVMIVS